MLGTSVQEFVMPRFVLLTHDFPFLHWDLMLEQGGALRTWRLMEAPDTPGPIPAEPLPDHRLHYLDYEGPVSGDRGRVTRWDAGHYGVLEEAPDRLKVELRGEKLRGAVVLAEVPADARESDAKARWTFCGNWRWAIGD